MNITHVVAEIYPLANVGGYSKVLHSLTKSQSKTNTVNIITPHYSGISSKYKEGISKAKKINVIDYTNGNWEIEYSILKIDENLTIFLINNNDYYKFRTNVYGYTDDANRWSYLSFCALELIKRQIVRSYVIHTHYWHTGILQNIKHQYYQELKTPVIFTVHNLKFQAMFDHRNSDLAKYDKWQKLPFFTNKRLQKLNFLKRAIKYADRCVFVSNGYLNEVLNGINDELLHKFLVKQQQKLTFVLNRIDGHFNPQNCKIYKNYDKQTFKFKNENKLFLQKKLKLNVTSHVPLLCFVGRLSEQKGIDILIDVLNVVLDNSNAQFVQLGGGDSNYIPKLHKLRQRFKNRVFIYGKTDFNITPQVYAASDICLIPSKFEPCGIVAMESQAFGCIPVVNATGCLKDTTINYLTDSVNATGFMFNNFDKDNFIFILSKALELFNNKKEWSKLVHNAMSMDFTWEKSADEYMRIYKNSIK